MAVKIPLVLTSGQLEQLQSGDTISLAASILMAFNKQSGTSYTGVIGDEEKTILITNAAPITFTVPPHSSVAYNGGAQLVILQGGAGQISIAPGAGVTINGPSKITTGQWSSLTLIQDDTVADTWYCFGNFDPDYPTALQTQQVTETIPAGQTAFTYRKLNLNGQKLILGAGSIMRIL